MEYFQDATTQRFTFTSYASGVTETTFAVLRFKGMEAISTPYEFEIMLVSGDPDVDLSALLQSQAVFTIHRDKGEDIAYNGILAEFDQLHAYNDHYFYRAKLVPKIWWLMQTQHNQVFLDKSVPEIIEGALVDGGMDSLDYDVSALEGTYNPVEYVCQYGESHFNFVSRWLEREGVYYYFYHNIDGDKLVLSDSSFSHEPFRQGADLVYSPKTGMEQGHLDELILNFTCRQKQLPNRIVLKDHNPERPSLEMSVRADVDPNGRGESFLYGEHYATPEEGERLVAFRAEELLCQKQEFHGDSTVPFLSPGFKFNMNRHYRSAFNQEYMVTSVTHEGDQTNLLKTSVIGSLTENADINIYSNSFTAIPADRQYRHTRTAERPRISGTLHGKIDGEQESPYAQLDEQGRYKVKLPFDINDEHIDGKASARVRMMQPYAGEGKGMQFPLTKGTEVLLTFIDGNPDRPVIAGAISSEVAPSPVSAGNQSESVIKSAGNNRIRMEDKAGAERIMFESPSSNSWLRVGAPNDPISLSGSSIAYVKTGEIWGSDSAPDQMGHGIQEDGSTYDPTPISIDWIRKQSEVDSNSATDYQGKALDDEGEYIVQYVHTGAEENAASNTARRRLFVFDTDDSEHPYYKKVTDGIRLFSNGSVWIESMDRYGLYTDGYPDYYNKAGGTDQGRAYIGTLLNKLENDYAPSGLKNYHDGTALGAGKSIKQLMPTAQVNVSSFDTITTQEGNIYDFGGYWNYNLGNSYEEAHINQSAELNSLDKVDILNEAGPNWAGVSWPSTTGGT
ncbi:MAG: type VI secretion system tip protein TssI/VgrG, partial [Saccharospirillum sp.]